VIPALLDSDAEETVAACAAWSATGAAIAVDWVTATDFHDPRCWNVVVAANEVDPKLSYLARVTQVAVTAGVWLAWVWSLIARAPVMWDLNGAWAARVRAAAQRRHQATILTDDLEALTCRRIIFGDALCTPAPSGAVAA
jgi:hypothetical protein